MHGKSAVGLRHLFEDDNNAMQDFSKVIYMCFYKEGFQYERKFSWCCATYKYRNKNLKKEKSIKTPSAKENW